MCTFFELVSKNEITTGSKIVNPREEILTYDGDRWLDKGGDKFYIPYHPSEHGWKMYVEPVVYDLDWKQALIATFNSKVVERLFFKDGDACRFRLNKNSCLIERCDVRNGLEKGWIRNLHNEFDDNCVHKYRIVDIDENYQSS